MYFSVKTSTKIMGKIYTPCVCYHAPDYLMPTIEKMAKEDKAYLYPEIVYFQNGKVLVKNVTKEEKKEEKPRKGKKTKETNAEEVEESFDEAEMLPAEDEGF